jgi:hypothetical protein
MRRAIYVPRRLSIREEKREREGPFKKVSANKTEGVRQRTVSYSKIFLSLASCKKYIINFLFFLQFLLF